MDKRVIHLFPKGSSTVEGEGSTQRPAMMETIEMGRGSRSFENTK
jgi:hypothetical protein